MDSLWIIVILHKIETAFAGSGCILVSLYLLQIVNDTLLRRFHIIIDEQIETYGVTTQIQDLILGYTKIYNKSPNIWCWRRATSSLTIVFAEFRSLNAFGYEN